MGTLGGYEVKKHGGKKDNGTVKARYLINMKEQGVLEVKVYNEFVSVLIRQVLAEDFQDSVGLMGTFEQGELVGRDLSTVFEDVNEFGFEWQVRDTDSMLFQESRFPRLRRRRLAHTYPWKTAMPVYMTFLPPGTWKWPSLMASSKNVFWGLGVDRYNSAVRLN